MRSALRLDRPKHRRASLRASVESTRANFVCGSVPLQQSQGIGILPIHRMRGSLQPPLSTIVTIGEWREGLSAFLTPGRDRDATINPWRSPTRRTATSHTTDREIGAWIGICARSGEASGPAGNRSRVDGNRRLIAI
jgi:hypothetical protein